MAGGGDKEDRTQPASQRRLQQARADGDVALSREVPGLVGLAAATLVLTMAGPQLSDAFTGRLTGLLAHLGSLDSSTAVKTSAVAALLVVTPLTLSLLVAAASSVLLQTGFLLKTSALMPDFNRLNPARGLSRLFGLDGLVDSGKSIIKLLVMGWAVWSAVSGAVPALGGAVFWNAGLLADHIFSQVLHLMLVLLGVQGVIAGADVVWVRYRHVSKMKMTREEVKRESQENDGNPHVKGKLRQMRMVRARRRMLAAVPTATVVVTNPTHYAIALVYDRNKPSAPRVVAKGTDEVAARIREMALDSRVPLVANPPLARALYTVELDAEIPAEHFKAVAEIIAYVWRLRTRAGGTIRP